MPTGPSAGDNRQTAAIVTTLRDAGPVLNSFITYHLAIGFHHIFLFFDDPTDASMETAKSDPRVTVIANDASLRNRWERTASHGRIAALEPFLRTEVMARQLLNVDVAIEIAREKQIDWLLHIDSDELFYSPGQTVPEHFQSLADRGVRRATYLNHEAVPETPDVVDYFREVTLFKENRLASRVKRKRKERSALAARLPQLPERFFYFYSNGKSAARVRPGLTAPGVHRFRQAEEFDAPMRTFNRLAHAKLTRAAGEAFWPLQDLLNECSRRLARTVVCMSPAVLHYPCCGFENFWNKYQTLGAFADEWWGHVDISGQIGPFHLESRDVVASGDRAAARHFYERKMVISDPAEIARLLEKKVFLRIDEPSALLEKASPRSDSQSGASSGV